MPSRQRRRLTKKKNYSERSHFKRRLSERYGIRVNRFGYRRLLDEIKDRRSVCVLRQSRTRVVHKIKYFVAEGDRNHLKAPHRNGYVEIIAVYDKSRGELVTALPHGLTNGEIKAYVRS